MKISVKVKPGTTRHLMALMLQKDLDRKRVALDMGITSQHLGRAFIVEKQVKLRRRIIGFIEMKY